MGRPKEFNENDVIVQAMNLFWEKGFAGTSLDALEQTTGLNRSSMYNSFGGKLDLFCKSLDAYSAGPCMVLSRSFRVDSGAAAILGYLDALRAFMQSRDANKGCLMVNTSIEAITKAVVRERVEMHFRVLRADFLTAYTVGLEEGSVNSVLTPEEAADWLLTFVRGVMVSAIVGESHEVLERSISSATKQILVQGQYLRQLRGMKARM